MAARNRHWLDDVYLAYFVVHIPIMLCVDLVPFYPSSWYSSSGPLSFLGSLRVFYLQTYKDQFFAPPPARMPSFFPLFMFLEAVFHMPLSIWAVGTLCRRRGLSGRNELLMLVYGLETALTTATCMWEAWGWEEALVTTDEKLVLVGGLYGGYFAVAVLLSIDMYRRLSKRLEADETRPKAVARKKKVK